MKNTLLPYDDSPMLLTIAQAAKVLNVPKASLLTEAQRHGFLVRMGRAIRIERESLGELVKKCRDQRREQSSTNLNTGRNTISETRDRVMSQRAAEVAARLKKMGKKNG